MSGTRILVVLTLVASAACTSRAGASLTMTIDTFTTDELRFTITGTFDEDVIGDQRYFLAVKSDWSNNYGTNTDWLADSFAFNDAGTSPWSVLENSILIGGVSPELTRVAIAGDSWGDSIYFLNAGGQDILAGTTVSGSFHATGDGFFTVVPNLELLSGFDDLAQDWARLEGVPSPATLAALALAGLSASRRKRD